MKTTIKILFLSGLIGLMAFSCRQNTNVSPNPPKSDTVTVATFPNQIGDSWTYSVLDSTTLKVQTVVVKVVGDTVFSNGGKFKIWEYRYPDKIDTGYVNIEGDTVHFNFKSGFYNTKYTFPLYEGKSWLSGKSGSTHSSTVENIESITVPAGTFKDCYQIKTTIVGYNYGLVTNDWFMPGVGFIQHHIYERSFGPVDIQVWKLVNYMIVNQN